LPPSRLLDGHFVYRADNLLCLDGYYIPPNGMTLPVDSIALAPSL
jgi:hypothetical protein